MAMQPLPPPVSRNFLLSSTRTLSSFSPNPPSPLPQPLAPTARFLFL